MTNEKHIEETPEMAKARKAKAALKNVAANTAEIIAANEQMATCMKNRADILRAFSKQVGGVYIKAYDNNRNYVPMSLQELLLDQAGILERGAV